MGTGDILLGVILWRNTGSMFSGQRERQYSLVMNSLENPEKAKACRPPWLVVGLHLFYCLPLDICPDVPPVIPGSQRFSFLLQITNNAGVRVTLVSNDAKPLNGENIEPSSMMTINKVTRQMRAIKFVAVESDTERRMQINGMDSVSVSPSDKQVVMPLVISGGF